MKKLDFVIAWVDGSDENHRLKRQQFQPENVVKGAAEDTRFAHNDEIYFSIASILKYVPYCGTIYIITDHQQPSFVGEFEAQGLCRSGQIQVVDHQEIFRNYQQYLPTFNSLTIETMLWNIPNLSQYFIYLNDDFFFNAPSKISDFLVDDYIKIYGHWSNNLLVKTKFNIRKGLNKYFAKPLAPKYTVAQMLSAELCGMSRYFEIHHRPHVLDKILFQKYFEAHPSVLEKQISYRFRSALQFLPVGLNNHLKIKYKQAELFNDIEIAYLKNETSIELFFKNLNNSNVKVGCIQSLDQFEEKQFQKISSALNLKFKDYLPKSIAFKSPS